MIRFAPLPAYKGRKIRAFRLSAILRPVLLYVSSTIFAGSFSTAYAVDLSGNPYIKAAPYKTPPLPPLVNTPSSRQAVGGSKANMSHSFSMPKPDYRPARNIDPSRAADHEQWCRRNHPSYSAADNTYRPFDKSGTMPPQARIPYISSYN